MKQTKVNISLEDWINFGIRNFVIQVNTNLWCIDFAVFISVYYYINISY